MKPKSEADLRLEELMLITTRLTQLTEEEIEKLETRRPREIETLVEQKAQLAAQYARLGQTLKRDQDSIKTAAPELRKALKEATKRFQKTLDELTGRLDRIREISEGLVRAIATDASQRRATPVGYGKTAAPPEPLSQPPMYLAFNRVV
jgi:flagellar biosynthesis/type III secretory pathway chaperone